MAAKDELFEGLPPPSLHEPVAVSEEMVISAERKPLPPPLPALKSALKRPSEPKLEALEDASEAQVLDPMKKIVSHITNPAKGSKASKLAMQLIQDGSVKPDYHALFSAAQDASEHLTEKQKNLLATWTINAVVANDLFTDESFVFSKTATRIKDIISSVPVTTEDDDAGEAAALDDANKLEDRQNKPDLLSQFETNGQGEADPFGLDALIHTVTVKNDYNSKGKKAVTCKLKREEVEEKNGFLKSRREALIACLEIATRRYKTPWCQTVIDILVQHALDNVSRFTAKQRQAIKKLRSSKREQQTHRMQGNSVSGKLDVNAFKWLLQKYENEKISIRSGGRRR